MKVNIRIPKPVARSTTKPRPGLPKQPVPRTIQTKRSKKPRIRLVDEKTLRKLFPAIVKVAQRRYDSWENENLREGLCLNLSDGFADVLWAAGIPYKLVADVPGRGAAHACQLVALASGVYVLDLPFSTYEKHVGDGVTSKRWVKIPNVTFDESDIYLKRLSDNPEDLDKLGDKYNGEFY